MAPVFEYNSPHDLTFLATGGVYLLVSVTLANAAGAGAINLVAGWDGVARSGAFRRRRRLWQQ